jgi:anti-anti-sigma factor
VEILEERDGNVLVVIPAGRLDVAAAADLQLRAMKLVEGGERRVVVDLARATEVSGAGLRVLLMLGKRLEGLGGALAVCGVAEDTRRALALAGLEGSLPVVPARGEAVAQVRAAGGDRSRVERVADLAARLLGAAPPGPKKATKKSGG